MGDGVAINRNKRHVLSVLANRTYRHLFMAQVIALIGTGLATVALGLLAYDIAGGSAGAVLGTALAIKMVAYIGVAPVVGAFADRLPRRAFLVSMDLVRMAVAICLPFVSQEIGRASCRERVCQYVSISVVAVSIKKKSNNKTSST